MHCDSADEDDARAGASVHHLLSKLKQLQTSTQHHHDHAFAAHPPATNSRGAAAASGLLTKSYGQKLGPLTDAPSTDPDLRALSVAIAAPRQIKIMQARLPITCYGHT